MLPGHCGSMPSTCSISLPRARPVEPGRASRGGCSRRAPDARPAPQQDRQHSAGEDRPERDRERLDRERIRQCDTRDREMRVPNEQARSRSEHSASASAAVSEMRGARATSATGPSTGTNAWASTSNTSLLVRMPPDWITITHLRAPAATTCAAGTVPSWRANPLSSALRRKTTGSGRRRATSITAVQQHGPQQVEHGAQQGQQQVPQRRAQCFVAAIEAHM